MTLALKQDSRPRGIRNNNPGNIRQGSTRWDGESEVDLDPEFEEFETPEMGIRAMARILTNYQTRHGLSTLRQIIERWAPPAENNTGAYVGAVARDTGIDPDAPINVVLELPALIPAIIRHENGEQPYSQAQIAEGINRAWA